MEGRAAEVAAVSVRFVSRLAPINCYGLYTGDGPAYCSGNRTVFVGTAAANRLMAKFGPQAEAGITFLIGHEIGHHIQNLNGRFHALSQAIYSSPDDGPDYVRRFELQADCLAGVWIHDELCVGDVGPVPGRPARRALRHRRRQAARGSAGSETSARRTARDDRAAYALVPARRARRRRRGMRHVRRVAALAPADYQSSLRKRCRGTG